MIKKNTVFILGAGASQPYGLPLGSALTTSVIQATAGIRDGLPSGIKPEDLRIMAKYLQDSSAKSVDTWLERNTNFIKEGKICIAREIASREGARGKTCDWYSELWNEYLLPECQKAEDILKNQVKFITFNYDRSLEYFLLQKLSNTFSSESIEVCHKIINQIEIIHVHGQAGYLPWQISPSENLFRDYTQDPKWDTAMRIAEAIQVVSETNGQTPAYLRAKEVMKEATYIYFLGFGYHEDNLSRLNIAKEIEQIKAKRFFEIFGSAYHLPSRDCLTFQSGNNPFGSIITLGNQNFDILEYMKCYVLKN